MIYIVRCSDTKEGNRHSFANHVGQTDQIVSPKGIKVSVLKCWAFLVQGTSKMLQFRDELGFETTERPCERQWTDQMDSWLATAGWVGRVGWLQKSGRRWTGAGPHCGFGVHLQPAACVWRWGAGGDRALRHHRQDFRSCRKCFLSTQTWAAVVRIPVFR